MIKTTEQHEEAIPKNTPVHFGVYKTLKAGSRGVVLTIPQKFAKAEGIKAGTPMHIYIQNGCLIIHPAKGEHK